MTPPKDEHLAEAVAVRRGNLRARAAAALATCLIVHVVVGWPGVWAWALVYAVGQAIETVASRTYLAAPSSRLSRWILLGALTTSSALFGGLAVPLTLYGGQEGEITGLFLLCGALINTVTVSRSSGRVFAALIAPMGLYAIALPVILSVEAEGLSGAAIVLAPLLTLAQTVGAWIVLSRARAAEQTARAAAEQRRVEAERAAAAKSAFVAMVSHELRTPLSGVMAAGDELQRRLEREENRQAAAVLVDAGRFMKTLLDDLLDLAKLEAGKMTVEAVDYDIGHLVWSLERHWGAAARGAGKPLRLVSAMGLPVRVSGDPTRLRQILNNLLSNAVKFTGPEGVTWTVDACEVEDRIGLTVRVTDTGAGMNAEQLDRLFTAFDQTTDSVARTHGGTGLGLAVSRELARAMGGELSVESEEGRGSTFVLHLPLALPRSAARPASTPEPVATRRDLRLLVVDDHPINRRTLALLLEPSGAEVTAVESSAAALERLAAEAFDAVLTDVNMPEMDGLALARALRARTGPNQQAPVIAVTGADSPEEQAACLAAGMSGCVSKPVDVRTLYAVLEGALAGDGAASAQAPVRAA